MVFGAHGIVTDFGGVIDVATQVGVGTTFTIWLPATGETPRLLDKPADELPRGNGETVMIVDDERPNDNCGRHHLFTATDAALQLKHSK